MPAQKSAKASKTAAKPVAKKVIKPASPASKPALKAVESKPASTLKDLFADDAVDPLDGDDDFDVPSFLQ